jgi:hypothetical protein
MVRKTESTSRSTDSLSVFVWDEVVIVGGVEAATKHPNGQADCQEDQQGRCLEPVRTEPRWKGCRCLLLLCLLAQ